MRETDRFDTKLPVEMGGIHGWTRNISATGIYFEAETVQVPRGHVHFTVEMHDQGEKLKLVCDGEVVRIDRKARTLGIAAKLVTSFFADAGAG